MVETKLGHYLDPVRHVLYKVVSSAASQVRYIDLVSGDTLMEYNGRFTSYIRKPELDWIPDEMRLVHIRVTTQMNVNWLPFVGAARLVATRFPDGSYPAYSDIELYPKEKEAFQLYVEAFMKRG